MLDDKIIIVVMPAYNAAKTLQKTYNEIPRNIVDKIIVTDDASSDETVTIAKQLDLTIIEHQANQGYGANQKTCYMQALKDKPDVVIMLHPDYQYSPKLVVAMASMILSGHYDLVLASRILGGNTIKSGMPLYKYISNRILTFVQNILCRAKLSEYHTGFRAYSRHFLESIPYANNSDDFVFDNEIIVQALQHGFSIGEISCPTRYQPDSSSVSFWASVRYGFGVLRVSGQYMLHRLGIKSSLFQKIQND